METKSKSLKRKKNPVIDTEPTLNTLENSLSIALGTEPLTEQLKASDCDYLINHGLGDKNHITYYRLAMMNPKSAVQNPQYRAYVGEILEKLMGIIWGDNLMQTRLKTILVQNHHGMVEEGPVVSMSQIRSLMNKKV